jgi:UDP-3-O-[3-hydroxymyristoyl] glucosamine N-acyltransferase
MKSPLFFKKKKNNFLHQLFPYLKLKKNLKINEIKPLDKCKKLDLTFFDSTKYKVIASSTKASYCLTTEKLAKFLPKTTECIIVKNVLFELAKLLKEIYPSADIDHPDTTLKSSPKHRFKGVKFCNNVLVGNNVKIGKNTIIGANAIIEKNVIIGENCTIGSQVIIKNSILGKNVVIQDNCKIGMKGFGFIPLNEKNLKFPHIGKVVINDDVEIATSCTIDRGSVDDTEIGKNTYLDNQVHIAHNVKIGSNCMIAGQVGFAGSTTIGNNVSIGGQAGISGHLTIGNNVKIGGGSGVIKDIPDNHVVMGYPAIPFKDFIKNWKMK